METISAPQPASSAICQTCHQPVLASYYFCPNCGTKLNAPPLPTSIAAQIGLYLFSIILPVICYLAITKWQGYKYSRSKDPKTRNIGLIAWALLIVSSVITFWYATVWVEQQIQASTNAVTAELNDY
jgi:hypothetical protein